MFCCAIPGEEWKLLNTRSQGIKLLKVNYSNPTRDFCDILNELQTGFIIRLYLLPLFYRNSHLPVFAVLITATSILIFR